MIPQVPCPAHGTFADSQGRIRYARSESRVICLMERYSACSDCEHRNFSLLVLKGDSEVSCPILEQVLDGTTCDDDPVRIADVQRIRKGGAIDSSNVTIAACNSSPLQSCAGCEVRRTWLCSTKK